MPLPSNYGGSNMAHPWGVAITTKGAEPGLTPISMTTAYLHKQTFTDPAVASISSFTATGITSTNLPNAATITYAAGAALLDGTLGATGIVPTPRNLVVTVTHGSSVVAMTTVVTGYDRYGRVVTETFATAATGTTQTTTGAISFAKVTSVAITAAADATANTWKLGTGVKMGLEFPCAVASAVKEIAVGAVVTNGTIVAASSSASADRRGTYAPNTAADGVNDYTIYYLVDDPNGF